MAAAVPARFSADPPALSGAAGGAQGSVAGPHRRVFGAGRLQEPHPPAPPAAAAAASAPRRDGGGGADVGPARHGCPAPAAGGWPRWALGRWGRWQRRRGRPGAGCRRGRRRARRAPRQQRGCAGNPRRCGRRGRLLALVPLARPPPSVLPDLAPLGCWQDSKAWIPRVPIGGSSMSRGTQRLLGHWQHLEAPRLPVSHSRSALALPNAGGYSYPSGVTVTEG